MTEWLDPLALSTILLPPRHATLCGGWRLLYPQEIHRHERLSEFLQTRIVDKPGVHVPKLTTDQTQAFGPYSDHYAVITDFNGAMDTAVKPLGNLLQKGAIRSLNDVTARRDDIKAVQTGLNDMGSQLQEQKAKADTAHAQLKQPEDLKVVYDKASNALSACRPIPSWKCCRRSTAPSTAA